MSARQEYARTATGTALHALDQWQHWRDRAEEEKRNGSLDWEIAYAIGRRDSYRFIVEHLTGQREMRKAAEVLAEFRQ